MRRIDTATAAADLFGPGKNGFRDGDPLLAILATRLNAEFFNSVQEELANTIEGAGFSLVPGDRTQLLQAIQSLSGRLLVAGARNAKMSVSVAGTTATLTATEVVVKNAAGALGWLLSDFNKTINLASTGAGGMDTGAAPASGYVALYAIYNPTTGASALLAKNAATLATEVYSGASMPAGYTASALVSVWPTNASGQLVLGDQVGRTVTRQVLPVLNSSTSQASMTALSIAGAVPRNANSCRCVATVGSSLSGAVGMSISSAPSGVGQANLYVYGTGGQTFAGMVDCLISTAQTIYYIATVATGTPSYNLAVSSYNF